VPGLAGVEGEFSVGLDVGSANISVAVGRTGYGKTIELLTLVQYPSLGVRKGMVVNIDEASRAISQAVFKAGIRSGVDISAAFAGFTCTGARILAVDGPVATSGWTMILPSNQVDNLSAAIEKAGLAVNGIMLNCQAVARLALREAEVSLGTVVLDLGAETTSIALVRNRAVEDLVVLPVGSGHITSDLAIGLHTDLQRAEELKRSYLSRPGGDDWDRDPSLQSLVNNIVGARVDEIMELIRDALEGMGCLARAPGGILFVGGGSRLPGLGKILSGKLDISVRIPDGENFAPFSDMSGHPEHAAVLGLLLSDADRRRGELNVRSVGLIDRIKGLIRKP